MFKFLHRVATTYKKVWEHEKKLEALSTDMKAAVELIKDRTNISAGITHKGDCTIVVAGRYRGQDYVEVMSVRYPEFAHIVDTLNEMRKYGTLTYLDCPHSPIRAHIKRGF